jgi:hypothetical protein
MAFSLNRTGCLFQRVAPPHYTCTIHKPYTRPLDARSGCNPALGAPVALCHPPQVIPDVGLAPIYSDTTSEQMITSGVSKKEMLNDPNGRSTAVARTAMLTHHDHSCLHFVSRVYLWRAGFTEYSMCRCMMHGDFGCRAEALSGLDARLVETPTPTRHFWRQWLLLDL